MFVNNVCAYVNKMFVCVCALTDKENKLESECVPMCARMHERERDSEGDYRTCIQFVCWHVLLLMSVHICR